MPDNAAPAGKTLIEVFGLAPPPGIAAVLTVDPEYRDTGLCDCDRCCNAQAGVFWFVEVTVGGNPVGSMAWCDACKRQVEGGA